MASFMVWISRSTYYVSRCDGFYSSDTSRKFLTSFSYFANRQYRHSALYSYGDARWVL